MRTVAGTSWHGGGQRAQHPVLFALLALDLGLVVLQYVLGMYVNLYVPIAFGTGGMMGMGSMWGAPALVWHMMNGWILFLLTLLIAVLSLVFGSSRLALTSWAAVVSVAVAGTGGMYFMMSGGNNLYSFVMAFGALGALLSLSVSLSLSWSGSLVRGSPLSSLTTNAREALDMRYAQGKISREEYLRAKLDITEV